MSTTRSLGLIIVDLLRLAVATPSYRNVLIGWEAIRKACPLHLTQGSSDFRRCLSKNRNRKSKIFCGTF